jgi:N-acetylglucosamine kinase-like BadF-type ATPase
LTTDNKKKRFLLGIDVGNSKTHAMIADLSGNVIGFAESGCGSYEVLGPDGYQEALKEITESVILGAGIQKSNIAGMGFGLAGYDWPSEKPIMDAGIQALGIKAPYRFVNDVVIGLIAGSTEGWGVAVDAGTGNNVRGRDENGREGRITGNGLWFGEFGGAGELVWRAMVMTTYSWSQRGPKTRLTQMFMEYAEAEDENQLIELLAMRQINPSPALAKEIFKLAAQGDSVASEVVNWNADQLGLNVNAVIRQLHFEDRTFEIVLIGSIFNAGEAYIAPLRETIHEFAPKAKLIKLSVPPVIGAILLAAEAIGLSTRQIRQTLIKSTKSYLTKS